jgi:hypothetical protein
LICQIYIFLCSFSDVSFPCPNVLRFLLNENNYIYFIYIQKFQNL